MKQAIVLAILGVVVCACSAASSPPTATPVPSTVPTTNDVRTVEPGAKIYGMQLIGPGQGWVLTEARLLWTNDNGASWTEINVPTEAVPRVGVFFLDEQHGWVSSTDPGPDGLESPSITTIYRTADGGETWDESIFEGPAIMSNDTGPPLFGGYPRFIDEKSGWFDGEYRGGNLASAVILHTTDSGTTWTRASPPNDGGFGHAADYPSATEAWSIVISYALHHTKDGGQTWEPVQLPVPEGCRIDFLDAPVFQEPLTGIVRVRQICDEQHGTAFYATKDGGASWDLAAYREGTYDSYIITQDRWLDVHEDAVYATEDGGTSWRDVTENWGTVILHNRVAKLQFMDETNGWVLVGFSRLYSTTDGGVTWELVNLE